MIQQNKKGFSLVEVMLLFTVLAVVLAASVPIISRKSSPVPNKINHGVYRCINTGDRLLEELYTGTRDVQRGSVEKCTFKVPTANMYRVDLYSAGAGGTLGATLSSQLNDFRLASYTSTANYTNFGNYQDAEMTIANSGSPVPKDMRSLISPLSKEEIVQYFAGENLKRYVYTRDAGKGGDAQIKAYDDPYQIVCKGQEVRENFQLEAIADNVCKYTKGCDRGVMDRGDLDKQEEAKYDAILAAIDEEKTLLDTSINAYTPLLDKAETIKKDYDDMITSKTSVEAVSGYPGYGASCSATYVGYGNSSSELCTAYSSVESALSPAATTIQSTDQARYDAEYEQYEKDKEQYDKDKDQYDDDYDQYLEDLEDYNKKVAEAVAGGKSQSEAEAEFTKPTAPTPPTYPWSPRSVKSWGTCINEAYAAAGDANGYIASAKTSILGTISTNITSRTAEKTTVATDASAVAGVPNKLRGVADSPNPKYQIGSSLKSASDISALSLTGAEDFAGVATAIKNKKDEVENRKKDLEDAAKTKVDAYTAETDDRRKLLQEIIDNSPSNLLKRLYHNKPITFDMRPGSTATPDTESNLYMQLKDLCKYGYGEDAGGADGIDTPIEAARASITNLGGLKGKGKYLVIDFPFTFYQKAGQELTLSDIETYLKNLQTPGHSESFYPVECKEMRTSGGALDMTCERTLSNISLDGKDKSSYSYRTERYLKAGDPEEDIYEYNAPVRTLVAQDGKDLKPYPNADDGYKFPGFTFERPYIAWQVPFYINGDPIGERQNIMLLNNFPTAGKGAKIEIDESNENKTYTSSAAAQFNDVNIKTSPKEVADYIFSNKYEFSIEKPTAENGKNAEFDTTLFDGTFVHYIYDDRRKTARVKPRDWNSTEEDPMYKDLRVNINSGLWTKSYQVGKAGESGKFKTYITTSLGKNCEFIVPKGGEPYIYGSGQIIGDLEKALAVSMTCTDKEGKVVFDRKLDGGKYHPALLDPHVTFYWYKGVPNVNIEAEKAIKQQWKATSIWAKAVSAFMRGYNNYDLSSQYGISNGGDGTALADSCTEPRGYYETQKEYILELTQGSRSYHKVDNKDLIDEPDGTKEGHSCYGNPGADDTFVSDFLIMQDENPYIKINAGSGGGGAVVVTW